MTVKCSWCQGGLMECHIFRRTRSLPYYIIAICDKCGQFVKLRTDDNVMWKAVKLGGKPV